MGQKLGMAPGREYTGSAVSLWKYGRNKIGADDRHILVALVQVLADHEGVKTLAEADDWLEAGNYRALNEAESRQVFPKRVNASGAEAAGPLPGPPPGKPSEPRPIDWPLDIPNEPYYAPRGREAELNRLRDLLERPDGPPVVSIDGLVGLGKTAIAAELARRLWQGGGWKGIVGTF